MASQSSPWVWPDATVTRVIDGDTIEARLTRTVDLGFRIEAAIAFPVKLRLSGINAPKITTDAGKAAAVALSGLLDSLMSIQTLRTYKYGGGDTPEWMATVTLADGRDASQAMIDAGHAVAWDGHGPRPGEST